MDHSANCAWVLACLDLPCPRRHNGRMEIEEVAIVVLHFETKKREVTTIEFDTKSLCSSSVPGWLISTNQPLLEKKRMCRTVIHRKLFNG